VKVSQLVPSTQVASPVAETPPAAVPFHEIGAEAGMIVPEAGLAAPKRKTDTTQSKLRTVKTVKIVQRRFPVIMCLLSIAPAKGRCSLKIGCRKAGSRT
jgi:hypothetical protein